MPIAFHHFMKCLTFSCIACNIYIYLQLNNGKTEMTLTATKKFLNSHFVPQSINLEGKQQSSQPRCFLIPVSMLSWTLSDQCNVPLSLWSCHQKTVACIYSFQISYCNSFWWATQRIFVQNSKGPEQCLRHIFRTSTSTHITPMFHSFHWLPIEQKIAYKLPLLCFEIISDQSPIYLSDLFIFTLLSGSSASLETAECSEYHPFELSPVISNCLNPTPWLCPSYCLSQFFEIVPENPFLFPQTFPKVPLPWNVCVHACVSACVYRYIWIFVV